MNIKILELTRENERKYIGQVVELEKNVLADMERHGKIGQLFITGEEDISEYVNSERNTVMIAIDENDRVIAATYITQGQKPFTYNDITKYFKVGDNYDNYVRSQYTTEEYRGIVLRSYELKIKAYSYARQKLLKEFPQFKNISEFISSEIESENQFDEKSPLREKINAYMSEYMIMQREETGDPELMKQYEQFYWMTAEDIGQMYNKELNLLEFKNRDVLEYERMLQFQREHQEIVTKGSLKIHEEPQFDETQYYLANTDNSIEIDTYITDPGRRHSGIARILVFEGIKRQMKNFLDSENQDIFLCSTLHRDNLSSKYVSEFFGLKDSLYVKRRQGRDREVHITRVKREDVEEYLADMEDKLAVLYQYNPRGKTISLDREKEILEAQFEYERNEFKRLNMARHTNGKYKGRIEDMQSKASKMIRLRNRIKAIREDKKMNEYGGDER